MSGSKNERVEVRLPKELKRWVKTYAKKRNTDVSHLIVSFLTDLKEQAKNDDPNSGKKDPGPSSSNW